MIIDYRNVDILIDNIEILKKVNLQVNEGDFIFLIGKVGSGKTSLLRTLYGMNAVRGDSAVVIGYDMQTIKRPELQELRRQSGIIFQSFQLLSDRNVYANLEFVLRATGWKKQDIPSRIEEVLNEVKLTDKADQFPHELSGGEQQRVAIARAILNNPKLIIADEPTGNLDPETSRTILDILYNRSRKGAAVLMSTHNLHLIPLVEARLLKCENGQLLEMDGITPVPNAEDGMESHEECAEPEKKENTTDDQTASGLQAPTTEDPGRASEA